jgi:hypothetical protein
VKLTSSGRSPMALALRNAKAMLPVLADDLRLD